VRPAGSYGHMWWNNGWAQPIDESHWQADVHLGINQTSCKGGHYEVAVMLSSRFCDAPDPWTGELVDHPCYAGQLEIINVVP